MTQFDQVLHHVDDAVVEFEIEDGEPIIVDANHAFRDIFSPDMKRVIGLALNELIVPAGKQEEAQQFDQRTADGRANVAFVERTTTDGEKTFLYRGIPVDGDRGFAIYTDVTGQLEQQHALTEILALATELNEQPEEADVVATAGAIVERAQELLEFNETEQSE